jgi:DNA-binding transcriptional LysR family regulator
MLNATWLETFTTLCEVGHFTRTAERLNMTQPGVSQHLRKLEAQLGQALTVRAGKSFALTPAGEEVLALGLTRRAEEAALRRRIAEDDGDVGALRIACSGSFALMLQPALLPWMAEAPQLVPHLEAAPQERVHAGLLSGASDLGILGADPAHPRLEARQVGREELTLLLPADATEEVTLAGLEARGLIAHPDGYHYADELLQKNFPESYPGSDRLRLRGYVNQIGQIPASVARGIGYTLLPRSGWSTSPHRAGLRAAPLPKRHWHALWLVQQRGRPLSARLQRAAAIIREVAEGLATAGED